MRDWVIFLSSLVFSLMVLAVINSNVSYTGFATISDATTAVNALASDRSLEFLGNGAQVCVVVEIDNETTAYYQLTKTSSFVDVQQVYCADPGQENVIVKFNSYDDLLSARANPKAFMVEKANTGYYLFPSNYVLAGGEAQCTSTFQQNYCAAFYNYFSKSEIASLGLVCCANYKLTSEQQSRLNEIKTGKPSGVASPFDFIFSTTGIIVFIIGIVLIIIIASLVVLKPKNPLADYVKSTRSQGYGDEDIKSTLIQSGWDEKTIDSALKK